MNLQLSKHAQERMNERGIRLEDIQKVLAAGKSRETRGNTVWKIDPKTIGATNNSIFNLLRVVCNAKFLVITVYWQTA